MNLLYCNIIFGNVHLRVVWSNACESIKNVSIIFAFYNEQNKRCNKHACLKNILMLDKCGS